MSLLDDATMQPYGKGMRITDEEIQVALAWLEGQLTYVQISRTLKGRSASAVYGWLAVRLREARKRGMIVSV